LALVQQRENADARSAAQHGVTQVLSPPTILGVHSASPGARPGVERHIAPQARGVHEGEAALFDGVFLGGFECSCHQLQDGRRLDLARSTRHIEFARDDYARLRDLGMTACRDGVSWVHAEGRAGGFDFSSLLPMVRAADHHGIQVIWDLMHFGWPPDIDLFTPAFPKRFARYAGAFARWLSEHTDSRAMVAPINEISFISWAGADVRCMNPFESARGVEMKVQLVRASIEAIEAIRNVLPGARFLQPEPVINIVPHPEHPKTWRRVEADNLLQYQAWDMLCGRIWPALGGAPRYLDIVGVNYYSDNQFMLDGTTVPPTDARYRPFSRMLLDVWKRYGRPMVVSETGHEGNARAPWFRYVCEECVAALEAGCELHGVTLYPIVNTRGWGDDRRCENGLWDDADDLGARPVHAPLAAELEQQAPRLKEARARALAHYEVVAISG